MYGKHFQSAYTGSMVGSGATVFAVWGYVIAHARDSYVELNPIILATIIGCPVDEIQAAIDILCSPDHNSRSKEENGCRLVKEGSFLYRVPTHDKYRSIRNDDDRREYMRVYMREYRNKNKDLDGVNTSVNTSKAQLAQSEAESEAESLNTSAELPALAPAERIPLNDGTEYLVSASLVNEFKRTYPAVDVLQELREMRAWSITNPTKRKTKRGILKFINTWLAREQDKGPRGNNYATHHREDSQSMGKRLRAEAERELDEKEGAARLGQDAGNVR